MLSTNRSAFTAVKVVLSPRPSVAWHTLFHPDPFPCVHSTFPTPLLAHIPSLAISPVQHRALYKKSLCCHVQVAPVTHTPSADLIRSSAHGSRRVWLSILWLVTTIINLWPCLLRSFTNLAVYSFLRISLSGLSLLVCLFLIGPRQRGICSAGPATPIYK